MEDPKRNAEKFITSSELAVPNVTFNKNCHSFPSTGTQENLKTAQTNQKKTSMKSRKTKTLDLAFLYSHAALLRLIKPSLIRMKSQNVIQKKTLKKNKRIEYFVKLKFSEVLRNKAKKNKSAPSVRLKILERGNLLLVENSCVLGKIYISLRTNFWPTAEKFRKIILFNLIKSLETHLNNQLE